jgi:acetyl esterase/lipase
MRRLPVALLAALVAATPAVAQKAADLPRLMSPRSLAALPAAAPDHVIRYGEAPVQQVELFLPRSAPADAKLPVVAIVHGGCWISQTAGAEQMRAAAGAFADKGFAVWSIGYRRVDEAGGGYPGTYQDVAQALDLMVDHAEAHRLDRNRVVLFGHSAGGHLALWSIGRDRLPADSPLKGDVRLKPRGVVGVGTFGDLEAYAHRIDAACAPDTLARLIGTGAELPREKPFADTSPAALLPTGVPTILLNGVYDSLTPPGVALEHAQAARAAGDRAEVQVAPVAGHFEVVAPGTAAFAQALAAVERLAK